MWDKKNYTSQAQIDLVSFSYYTEINAKFITNFWGVLFPKMMTDEQKSYSSFRTFVTSVISCSNGFADTTERTWRVCGTDLILIRISSMFLDRLLASQQ